MRRTGRWILSARAAVVLAIAALLVVAPAAPARDPGLLGQWPMDAISGTGASATTADVSGNAQTGGFENTPTLQAGRFGNALNLAASPQRMRVGNPGGAWPLEPASQVSVTTWIKTSSFPGALRYIASKGNFGSLPSCNGSSYALYTGVSTPGNPFLGLTFYVWTSTGGSVRSPVLPSTSPIWTDNAWHAVTGTYDGARVRLYVDGAEVGTGNPASGPILYSGSIADAFTVGRYADPGCPDPSQFPGGIDEVRVHDRALTAAQVGKLHDPSATTPPDLAEPPPPGGDTPPSPSPTPTPEPAAPPVARLTAPAGTASVSRPFILDASATRGATTLQWDLDGNGKQDVITPASQPYLSVRPVSPGPTRVKLTAVGAGGATSSVTSAVTVGGPSLSAAALKAVKPLLITAAGSSPSKVNPFGTIRSQLEILRGACVEPTTVTFGLVEATSCFARTANLDEVPDDVRDVVRRHYDSERYPQLAQTICNLAARGERPQQLCEDAKAMFAKRQLDVYVTQGPVTLNGMRLVPKDGSSIAMYPKQQRLIASNATLTWGSFTIQSGVIDMNLERQQGIDGIRYSDSPAGRPGPNGLVPPNGRARLLYFDAAKSVPSIGGFKLNGTAELSLQAVGGVRSATANVHVQLPSVFNMFGGAPPTGDVRLSSSNAAPGPNLDNLDLQLPEANLGAAYLRDVRFRYARAGGIDGDTNAGTSCDRHEWKAQANLYIGGQPGNPNATAILMAPQPSQNGIGFCRGAFKHAGFRLELGKTVRPQVFPGVFLSQLNFAMQLDPTLLRGGAGLSVGDVAQVDGAFLVAFASPSQPYRLSAGDAGAEFAALEGRVFQSTTVAAGGAVKVNVPKFGQLGLGNGAVMYSYPDFVAFGGSVRVVLPGLSVEGGLNGWVEIDARRFSLGGSAQACIAGFRFACIGAQVLVGSRGVSACGNIGGKRQKDGSFKGGLNPGAGLLWADPWPTIWLIDGCKPSRFWTVSSRTRAKAAQDAPGELSFTVTKGETAKNLRIAGAGGAPMVRITGPGGQSLEISGDANVQDKALAGLRQPEGNVTWAGVDNGPTGRYRIEPLPGSVPITGLEATRPDYSSAYKASVRATGPSQEVLGARAAATGTRTLQYDTGRPAGQVVTFVEQGADVNQIIGTSRGGKGTLRFTPAPGRAISRRIVAQATIDGVPIPEQVVTRYRVGATTTPKPAASVTARRRGTGVRVGWAPVAGARAYSVTLKSANGPSRTRRVSAGRRALTIPGVPRDYAGTVTVAAQDALGRWGKPRTARFARRNRPFTALQSTARNQRRDNR